MVFLLLSACNKKDAPRSGFVSYWSVQPSLVYDSCHLIGILTGRSLYTKYYSQVYRDWSWNLPAEVQHALAQIDQVVGPQWPPGPRLSMLLANFPPVDSLREMVRLLQDDERMHARIMASDYASAKNWQQWQGLKPHVITVLEYLRANHFENYWRSKFLPELLARIPAVKQELQAYDVVGDVERFLGAGFRASQDTLEIYYLALGQPHEVRLRRQARLMNAQLPHRPVVRNFYREMLHPHCDRLVDSVLAAEFTQLFQDDFLQRSAQEYSRGMPMDFNSFCKKELVQAAEWWLAGRRQLLSPAHGAGLNLSPEAVRNHLKDQNPARHSLAVAIYSYLEAGLKPERISYADFVRDLFASGKLRAGKIAGRYQEFFRGADLAQQ